MGQRQWVVKLILQPRGDADEVATLIKNHLHQGATFPYGETRGDGYVSVFTCVTARTGADALVQVGDLVRRALNTDAAGICDAHVRLQP
jgi:hypothetical protein